MQHYNNNKHKNKVANGKQMNNTQPYKARNIERTAKL